MTREELKEHCKKQVENCEIWAAYKGKEPCGKVYEEHKLILELLEQEPRWIPVSERLPEEREWIGTKKFGTTISDEVYVTFESLNGECFCEHIRFQNGKLSPSKQIELDAISKGSKPIAWMPLPKPYREAASENDV